MTRVTKEYWDEFSEEVVAIAISIAELRSKIGTDRAKQYFLHRLIVACENATGCIMLAKAELAAPLGIVSRALFESFIATYWASLSEANTEEAVTAAEQELKRIMRNLIKGGRAKIIERTSGKDRAEQILNEPTVREARPPKRFDQMATEAGVKNIYDVIYGLSSLLSHGNAPSIHVQSIEKGELPVYEEISLVRACVKAIALICRNRIEGKATVQAELENILKVKFSS